MENQTCEKVNLSDPDNVTCYLAPPSALNMIKILYPIILSCGVFNNVLFLVVCVYSRKMHNATNFYLSNLAVADVTFLLFGIGEQTVRVHFSPFRNDNPISGKTGCIPLIFLNWYFYITSILIVTVVTIERYLAICRPIKYQIGKGKMRTLSITILIWLIPIGITILCIPMDFEKYCALWPEENDYVITPDEFGICVPKFKWLAFTFHVIIMALVNTCMVSVFVMCWKIIRKLHLRTQQFEESNVFQERSLEVRNNVAFMLTANAVVFFLCQAPYQFVTVMMGIENFVQFFGSQLLCTNESWNKFVLTSNVLLYINSSVNPVVYNATNPQCRKEYKYVFYVLFRKCSNYFMNLRKKTYKVSTEYEMKEGNCEIKRR